MGPENRGRFMKKPKAKPQRAKKPVPRYCIVKNCENSSEHGGFVGNICQPCYDFITTSRKGYSVVERNVVRLIVWHGGIEYFMSLVRTLIH